MMNKRKKCKVEKCNKYVNELSDGEPWVDHGLCLEHYEAKMKKLANPETSGHHSESSSDTIPEVLRTLFRRFFGHLNSVFAEEFSDNKQFLVS
ncbi:MAG: hypothetical protein IIB95_08335 [Candidatus Marinimicrobia bacterium]|nr:hypothetical protein [Candidatus Neomarinimicrobiota bacterium]